MLDDHDIGYLCAIAHESLGSDIWGDILRWAGLWDFIHNLDETKKEYLIWLAETAIAEKKGE